jgi:thioredoxin 1
VSLKTLQPNPAWDAESRESTVDALAALAADEDVEVHVWGADWCGDCRSQLPDFAAALDAAAFPADRRHVHPVDRDKDGDLVDEYGVEYIPTVVVERDGTELARFVESEPLSAATYLAEELEDAGALP